MANQTPNLGLPLTLHGHVAMSQALTAAFKTLDFQLGGTLAFIGNPGVTPNLGLPLVFNGPGTMAQSVRKAFQLLDAKIGGAGAFATVPWMTPNLGLPLTLQGHVAIRLAVADAFKKLDTAVANVTNVAALGNRFAIAGQTVGSANNLRTSKVRSVVNTTRGGTGVRFLFVNRSLNNGGAPAGSDSLTIRASVIPIAANSWVTGATVYAALPVTFSGSTTKVLAPGEWVWSDPVAGWSPAAGAEYDLITNCLGSSQASVARFMTTGTRGFRQEGFVQASATDASTHDAYILGNFGRGMTATTSNNAGTLGNSATLSGGNGLWTAASQIWAVDPDAKVVQNVGFTNAGHTTASITSPSSRVWGANTYLVITDNMTVDNTAVFTASGAVYTPSGSTESVAIFGDSNDRGYGSGGDAFGDFKGNYGISERVIDNQYGFLNFAVLGNTASAQSTPANGVMQLFTDIMDGAGFTPTRLYMGSSTNDFASPTNYSADLVRNANNLMAAPFKAKGTKIFPRTCFPRTNAGNTDGVSSGFLAGGARDIHNGYVRGGTAVTGQDGYIEVSTPVENVGNPVIWREDFVVQTDKIHITSVGIDLVRASNPLHVF